MALPVAARPHGARRWSSSRGALPGHAAAAAAATVRFSRNCSSNGGGRRAVLCLASGGRGPWEPADSPWDGRLVDEGMATLRQRIREAKALPASGPDEDDDDYNEGESGVDGVDGLPVEWTELERRHHGSYVAGVRATVAVLQALLLRTRPGLGAGVVALFLLSVPASLLIVSSRLIEAVDSISSAVLKP